MLAALKKALFPTTEAHALYANLVAESRHPFLFETCGIPDTLDGRYESIILHIYLRTKGVSAALKQRVMEAFVEDMDRSLREMGVGDTGVGKRVKKMAAGLFGRLQAYEKATDQAALEDVLKRNVYSTCEAPPTQAQINALVAYISQP
jgi:cytochrome b pre-mRNA-processing protein 3